LTKPNSSDRHSLTQEDLAAAYEAEIKAKIRSDPRLVPYFVTTTFIDIYCKSKISLLTKINYAWATYASAHTFLLTKLMPHFSKKRHLHPITYDFIDLPGTRYTTTITTQEPDTPHIHSIYLVDDRTHTKFEEMRSKSFSPIISHDKMRNVMSIHAQPLDPETTGRVISYASKLFKGSSGLESSRGINLFNQYPIGTSERESRSVAHTDR
jgi:hypothetical protein